MKNLIFLVVVVVLCLLVLKFAETDKNKHTLQIERTENGYNIYSKGELVLEFTEQNTDSLSMDTLEQIYFETK